MGNYTFTDPTVVYGTTYQATSDVKALQQSVTATDNGLDGRIAILEGLTGLPKPASNVYDITASPYNTPTNGTSNAATGIQAAIDAAATAYASDGQQKIVWFPAGTYVITATISYKTGVTLRGAGKDVTFLKNTTTRGSSAGATVMLQPNTTAGTVHNVTIERMTIDQRGDFYDASADSTDDMCISIEATHRTVIQDCYFRNIRTMAVWCDSLDANPTTNHLFQRNHIFQAGGDGVSYFGAARGIYVYNNIIEATEDDAIAFQSTASNQCRYVEAIGNQVLNCSGRTSYGSTPHGVLFQGVLHGKCVSNNVFHIYSTGVHVYDFGGFTTGDITIDDNVINGTHVGYPGVGATGAPGDGIWISAAATSGAPVYVRRNVIQNVAATYVAINTNSSTNIVTT